MTSTRPDGDESENDVTLLTGGGTSPVRGAGPASVTVRYWGSARSAAGVAEDEVTPGTLADALAEVRRRHASSDRFDDVVSTCAVLVGETPVGARPHADVALHAGDTVELLPPFAGG